jgi:hypothetical protein
MLTIEQMEKKFSLFSRFDCLLKPPGGFANCHLISLVQKTRISFEKDSFIPYSLRGRKALINRTAIRRDFR